MYFLQVTSFTTVLYPKCTSVLKSRLAAIIARSVGDASLKWTTTVPSLLVLLDRLFASYHASKGCVGANNHHHFIMFLAYVWLACCYAGYMSFGPFKRCHIDQDFTYEGCAIAGIDQQ